MTRHEVIYQHQDLPTGYESYSILLIPDSAWFSTIPPTRAYDLFFRFKQFGEAIGSRHLAAWLYKDSLSMRGYDLDIFAAISAPARSEDDVRRVLSDVPALREHVTRLHGRYDVIRAKYFCALYKLPFGAGPYIGFFEQRPVLPILCRKYSGSTGEPEPKTATKPAFLLKFGGLAFEDMLALLNQLEYGLVRGHSRAGLLKLQQVALRIEGLCKRLTGTAKASVDLIKDVKEAVELPLVKNLL